MKRLLAMAALLLVSSAARAQYEFEYGGRTIRIDPDRGTISIPGIYDNTGKRSKRAKTDQGNLRKSPPQDAKAAPQVAPAPTPAPTPADAASSSPPPTPPAPPVANSAPADSATPPPLPSPLPPIQDAAPQQLPAPPAPAVAAVPSPTPPPAQRPRDPNSPIGVWLTEEKEGKVRIEQCGVNLCGYSVDAKSSANGEPVLINMRPGQGKWSGRILDPNTGSTYDSTIAMKGPDTLRVQGCAFGGMFCGGQTWTRVN
jgi:uncharacterized protein (DUF2147 family)